MSTPQEQLEKEGWYPSTLDLAIKTGFRCAYCGLDFMSSIDAYYSFEVEHIVPLCKRGSEDLENKAAVCSTCNFLKRGWDPRSEAGDSAGREQLLETAKRYVLSRRREKEEKLSRERALADSIRKK
jgi:hypothetical protein